MKDDDGWWIQHKYECCEKCLFDEYRSIERTVGYHQNRLSLCFVFFLLFSFFYVPFQIYSLQKKIARIHEWIKWVERRDTHSGTKLFIGHHFCSKHIPIRWVRPMTHNTQHFDILWVANFELTVLCYVKSSMRCGLRTKLVWRWDYYLLFQHSNSSFTRLTRIPIVFRVWKIEEIPHLFPIELLEPKKKQNRRDSFILS